MKNVIRHIFRFAVFLILGYIAFMCFILGLFIGTLIIISVCLVINYFTMEKEKFIAKQKRTQNTIKDLKERVNCSVETTGEYLKLAADTAGILCVKTGKAIGSGVKSGYKEMGGREGAKKMAKEIGKAAEESVVFGSHLIYEVGEGISKGSKTAKIQIEAKKKDRAKIENQNKTRDLTDVIYKILDD